MSQESFRQSEPDRARVADRKSLKELVHEFVKLAGREAQQRSDRKLTWFFDDDGTFVIEGRLPVEEGQVLIQVIEAACKETPNTEEVSAAAPNVT